MFARPYICFSCCRRPASRFPMRPQTQFLHASPRLALPRRKDFFSSNAHLKQKQNAEEPIESSPDSRNQRRRGPRSPAAPTSLRRVAVEAQRSKDSILSKSLLKEQGLHRTKVACLTLLQSSSTDCLCLDSDRLRRRREI